MGDASGSMAWDEEYDVVCVGSGIGGLSTAITAAEKGATVVVIEKFHLLGGVTALSSGQLWVGPNHVSEAAGIKDDLDKAQSYMTHLTQNLAIPEIRDAYFSGAREAIHFFVDTIGMELEPIRGLPDYYYPAVDGSAAEGRYLEPKPFSAGVLGEWAAKTLICPYGSVFSYSTSNDWVAVKVGGQNSGSMAERIQAHTTKDERCAGAGMAAAQVYASLKRGVEFRISTEVVELVVEDARVIGVITKDISGTGTRRIHARKGVMLSTGGYDWRPDFVRSFDALPVAGSMALPTVTGDHFVLASKVSAIPIPSRTPVQSPIFIGYRSPNEKIYDKPAWRHLVPGAPHTIIVNKSGNRFGNDSFYPDIATKVGRFDGQEQGMANWPAWLIFDQHFVDNQGLLPGRRGETPPENLATQAATLAELAAKVGISPSGLEETVARFNGFCKDGVDPDFARGTVPWGRIMTGNSALEHPNFGKLFKAPFYAVKIERVTMGVPTAGLPIDKVGRVLNAAGEVVPGLYATGNSTAWHDWGAGYNSGIAMMRGMLYGYLGGLDMVTARSEEK